MKVIISGGGTAGHIYPALATADELKKMGVELLFVGAQGKMEMERVPAAGYKIVGLPVAGIKRKLTMSNLVVPFKLLKSMMIASNVIRDFKPDVVVGFGGYASAPILKMAQKQGIRTVIQEQNSYAGLTNKMLARKADVICTAYEGMERFFDPAKIVLTGNPLRIKFEDLESKKGEGYVRFGLNPAKKTILVTGGSLGTRTLNEAMMALIESHVELKDVQIIWQCGKFYHAEMLERLKAHPNSIIPRSFIERMDLAYAIADVVVCRAGASTVSELELLGKAAIFVPSPNVAEDHQTKNAMNLVERGAAMMVRDSEAVEKVFDVAFELLGDGERLAEMSQRIKLMGKPHAARDVAHIVAGVRQAVYFVGIGGIGMSALARFFHHEGYRVAGYDRTHTPLTQELENEGIEVHYQDSVANISDVFKDKSTKVIYTPAIPKESAELNYFMNGGFDVVKRSKALGLLANGKYLMAVAGTHGKTTTTTMVAWFNGEGSAFLGGISKNFGTNMVLGHGECMAVEADEFDRSFHQLFPNVALITSTDPDHLDIYGTPEEFKKAFAQFASQVKDCVIAKLGVDIGCKYRYSLNDDRADYYARNIELLQGGYYRFDIVTPTGVIEQCTLGIPGLINVENCVGAVAVVAQRGFDEQKLKQAISSFSGVARRFDFWLNEPTKVYMDDYAHHPDELNAMLSSVKKMFPARHVTIVFQPHLFTRTRDFYHGFAEALSLADHVILLPIYPARELPIEGVESELILNYIISSKEIVFKENLAQRLHEIQTDIVITAGAGDIDQLRESVFEVVKDK